MVIPLVEDIRGDRPAVRRRMTRALLFLILLFGVDLVVGSVLQRGLERYFGLDAPADVLLVGHSHTVLAVDKVLLEERTGLRVAKYAREGANMADRMLMVRQYIARHPDSLRLVVLGVDAHVFTTAGLSRSSYRNFLPFLGEPVVRGFIGTQEISRSELLLRTVLRTSRFNETTLNTAVRGLVGDWSSYKQGRVDIARLEKQIASGDFRRISFDAEEGRLFDALRDFLRERGVGLVLVYYPTVDIGNGAEPERFAQVMARLSEAARPDAGVWLLDYNPEYASRHELFYDPIHLNREGQAEITKRLARDLLGVVDAGAALRPVAARVDREAGQEMN